MKQKEGTLPSVLEGTFAALDKAIDEFEPDLRPREVGQVVYAGKGVARVAGLPSVRSEEILTFPGGLRGLAFNVDPDEVGVLLLGDYDHVRSEDRVQRTGQVLQTPVGEELLGRVVDPTGLARDELGSLRFRGRRPAEKPAPAIMDRQAVSVPLMSGLKVVDALIPVGRGQRELILGDRQTGKTALAVDTLINQKGRNVLCIYCAVGQRSSSIARLVDQLKEHDALHYTTVVVAEGDDPPGLQYIAPFAATSMAEFFMEQGRDVLVVYDDLTRHARAYRELSLLLRRPPGREAFPGDIFYLHSRLLERSTHLREELGGGSLTALPIIETEAQNISAYIPTNLISITDGQIYLSPDLFRKGLLPSVDVGKSVSRVGGKTQLPAYRKVAGDLKLSYAQFEELEVFARFGTRLDKETRQALNRGRRVRALLKQPQFSPLSAPEQVIVLYALNQGLFDDLQEDDLGEAEKAVRAAVDDVPEVAEKIEGAEELEQDDLEALLRAATEAIREFSRGGEGADAPGSQAQH